VGPLICIEKFNECTEEFGVSYLLSNGHLGILFNDGTYMIMKDTISESIFYAKKKDKFLEINL